MTALLDEGWLRQDVNVSVEFRVELFDVFEHVCSTGGFPVPNGDNRVGEGGHFAVTEDTSDLAVSFPIGTVPDNGKVILKCPRCTEDVDTGGSAAEDGGDLRAERCGFDDAEDEVAVEDGTGTGDDGFHMSITSEVEVAEGSLGSSGLFLS